MPVFSDVLKMIKGGYDEILSNTLNDYHTQIGQAQEQLHSLNKENKDLLGKHKQAA